LNDNGRDANQGCTTQIEVLKYKIMLGEHTRTTKATFRKERSDSLVKNLKKEYPQLAKINGNTKLGTLLKEKNVDSLSQLLKKAK
jgi:hypothetical protein